MMMTTLPAAVCFTGLLLLFAAHAAARHIDDEAQTRAWGVSAAPAGCGPGATLHGTHCVCAPGAKCTGPACSKERHHTGAEGYSPRHCPGCTCTSTILRDLKKTSEYAVPVTPGATVTGPTNNYWVEGALPAFYDCRSELKAAYPVTGQTYSAGASLSQEGEDQWVHKRFFHADPPAGGGASKRRFIELGALDGRRFSNSYLYEKSLGWGGLLIEGSTANYVDLEKNRAANPSVTCLHAGVCATPQTLKMAGSGPMAAAPKGDGAPIPYSPSQKLSFAPCLPMRDLVSMAKIDRVDLYSIDVEGAELAVIETHDFEAAPAFVLVIEMRPADELKNMSNAYVRQAVHDRGFCRFTNLVGHNNEVWLNEAYPYK